MTNDQIENLEASHWFNQLIQLVELTELFSKHALNLQNKAQKKLHHAFWRTCICSHKTQRNTT